MIKPCELRTVFIQNIYIDRLHVIAFPWSKASGIRTKTFSEFNRPLTHNVVASAVVSILLFFPDNALRFLCNFFL